MEHHIQGLRELIESVRFQQNTNGPIKGWWLEKLMELERDLSADAQRSHDPTET